MSKISDEELDQLFRNGLNDNDLEYEKDAWEEISPLLGSKGFNFALLLRVAAVLLVFIASAAIAYKAIQMNGRTSSTNPVKAFGHARVEQPADSNPTNKLEATERIVPMNGQSEGTSNLKGDNASVNTAENQISQDGITVGTDTQGGNVPGRESYAGHQKDVVPSNIDAPNKPNLPVKASWRQDDKSNKLPLAFATSKRPLEYLQAYGLQQLRMHMIEMPAMSLPYVTEWQPETLIPTERNKSYLRHFYGGITLAPDLSFIGFAGPVQIGNDIGLVAGYRFSDHIEVQTGIVRAHKFYQTDGDEQYDPFYYSGSNLSLNKVDANCKVLEIPVNARFSALISDRDALTLGLGVSSYLMTHEKYTYYYEDLNTREKLQLNQSIYNQHKYWFGIADFSVGYRRHLSPRMDFTLDAFGKVPFSEIGEGETQLISVGTNFTLLFSID